MITPSKLPAVVKEALLARLKDEYTASHHYSQAAQWFRNNGFELAAKFFEAEAVSELEHAKGIERYLTDWNENYSIPVPELLEKPDNFAKWIEASYNLENGLYGKYQKDGFNFFNAGHLAAFTFIQKYIQIQNDSVIEYSDMLNVMMGITGGKFELLLIEEKLFGEKN